MLLFKKIRFYSINKTRIKFLFILLLLFINKSINCQIDSNKFEEINIYKEKSTDQLIKLLKLTMLDYLEMDKYAYAKKDVNSCINFLNKFKESISNSISKKEGDEFIKQLIINLNILNRKCEGRLIETDQREIICEIIIREGFKKGYNLVNEDITEKYREW